MSACAHAEENVRDVLARLEMREGMDFTEMTLREFAPWFEKEVRKADPSGKGIIVTLRKSGSVFLSEETLNRKLDFDTKGGCNFLSLLEFAGSMTSTRFVAKGSRGVEIIEAVD